MAKIRIKGQEYELTGEGWVGPDPDIVAELEARLDDVIKNARGYIPRPDVLVYRDAVEHFDAEATEPPGAATEDDPGVVY